MMIHIVMLPLVTLATISVTAHAQTPCYRPDGSMYVGVQPPPDCSSIRPKARDETIERSRTEQFTVGQAGDHCGSLVRSCRNQSPPPVLGRHRDSLDALAVPLDHTLQVEQPHPCPVSNSGGSVTTGISRPQVGHGR
jgi:hypothetical protein